MTAHMSASSTRRKFLPVLGAAVVTALLAACSSASSTDASSAETGTAPDLNGDGEVVIGVLSPGDINDKGFYQGFVDSAEAFAQEHGWTLTKRGGVPPGDALAAARALCQQGVDMVALAASELKDAIPASEEPVCSNTMFYTAAAANVEQAPRLVISSDDPVTYNVAVGYAAGLKMLAAGSTQAGFVSGIEADFSVAAADGYTAGIRMLIPDATVVTTYTGDSDNSALAQEAVRAHVNQDVSIIYPYLGGATDAAASVAQENGVMTISSGTDRCDSTDPTYNISAIFNPGEYFQAALEEFAENKLEMGTTRAWVIGVDPFPTALLCDASEEDTARLEAFLADLGSGEIDAAAEVARLTS